VKGSRTEIYLEKAFDAVDKGDIIGAEGKVMAVECR
jgi:hypothetical protein